MAAAETSFRVMASDAHVIVVNGPADAGDMAVRALAELEQAWSRFLPNSDVSRLNNSPGLVVDVNEVTITLVETMVQAWTMTSGLLDPTVLPAMLDAGYTTSIDGSGAVTQFPLGLRPGSEERSPIATLADVTIDRSNHTVVLPAGIALDPGGLGKGLAADLVVAELLARGVGGALVSIGGDLAAAGTPSSDDGWCVVVEDPFDMNTELVRLAFDGGGIATSSTLSRRWTHNGAARHHLIDPATGAPSLTDVAAVTVLASCGWQAEAHATAAILSGAERFLDYANRHQLAAIATSSTGRTTATEKLRPLLQRLLHNHPLLPKDVDA